MYKTYTELSGLKTFEERYRYLQLSGQVGEETFGFDRFMNQRFYNSPQWKSIRNFVIVRDGGRDLGAEGYDIYGRVLVHHMNPIRIIDFASQSERLLNPEYLVTTSNLTHNAIHYGDEGLLLKSPEPRRTNDTCPWKKSVMQPRDIRE